MNPGCLSRIPYPNIYASRIPDSGSRIQQQHQKRRGKKTFCPAIFCSHKYHEILNNFILNRILNNDIDIGNNIFKGGLFLGFATVLYSTLLPLPTSQIPPCRRMLGSNPGQLRLRQWQSDAPNTRQNLIHNSASSHPQTRLDLIHNSARSHLQTRLDLIHKLG